MEIICSRLVKSNATFIHLRHIQLQLRGYFHHCVPLHSSGTTLHFSLYICRLSYGSCCVDQSLDSLLGLLIQLLSGTTATIIS